MDIDGRDLGLKFIDEESGDLSINIGKIYIVDNELRISFDVRYPIKMKLETLFNSNK